MEGLEGNVTARWPLSSNETQGLAALRTLHHHSWSCLPRRSFRRQGLKTQLCWSRPLPFGVCSRQHHSNTIDTQIGALPAALTRKPTAAQVVPALCASSFRLCSSCSHIRHYIWRPILVHELCHAAALRQSHESTTLHLSA